MVPKTDAYRMRRFLRFVHNACTTDFTPMPLGSA